MANPGSEAKADVVQKTASGNMATIEMRHLTDFMY
jgi:hypothetical protein